MISDLNRAMYVIYAQFLDMGPSLAYKASPNSNLAPERAQRPYTYNDFYSPGSVEDSGPEYYATSSIKHSRNNQRSTIATEIARNGRATQH
jgi:hypothetical protein